MLEYEERFTNAELNTIIEQAMLYMCACPAQVADAIRKLRELYRYQMRCLESPENTPSVHHVIAQSTIQSHTLMQDCLEKVITLENWDRSTLQMPPNLRQRQMREVLGNE